MKEDQQTAEPQTEQEQLRLAKAAIYRVLNVIANDPRKFWFMGDGTESYERLTAAASALENIPVEKIKADFRPKAADFERYCRHREIDERFLSLCRSRVPTESEVRAWWKEVA